jgi:hypothetical protein
MTELGPELFEALNAGQHVGNRRLVQYGAAGISVQGFAAIEEQLGFRLPEDFKYLFANLRDPGGVFFPWATFKKKDYDASIDWIWHTIAFDIEHNVWLDRWGNRPEALAEALRVARSDFLTWPKLLPIFGHRYLAAEPCGPGNPIFSVYQLDIIYYGADLADYLSIEFLSEDYAERMRGAAIQRIDVWSDFAEQVYKPYGR